MFPPKFESLLSPPWPESDKDSPSSKTFPQIQEQLELANFELNDESNDKFDHIAMLGYN